VDELRELGRRLDRPVLEFTRMKQAEFAEAGLSRESGEEELLRAMAAAPILMERPILVRGPRAVLAYLKGLLHANARRSPDSSCWP